jgi:2-octaprenyl-6-methoxyphenol hydroxylase
MSARDTDVLIAGGGPVGLALALALRRTAPSLGVTLVDPASGPGDAGDMRASAVVVAGRRMLEQLGVWRAIAADAQPIEEMIVTDSRTRDTVRPVFLTFAGQNEGDGPFAHMVMNRAMTEALRHGSAEAGVAMLAAETVADFSVSGSRATATLASGGAIEASLIVAADGVRSQLRDIAGIKTLVFRYGQAGIVATVAHERPHHGRAGEHFLPGGPFAILPLKPAKDGSNRSSLVWTERQADAERLVAGDRLVLQVELERRFGRHLGALELVDEPRAFSLDLTLARNFVAPRFALAGDAAHGIHPIAGQGLNLGFRDVAALAETIVEAHRLVLDVGLLSVLHD